MLQERDNYEDALDAYENAIKIRIQYVNAWLAKGDVLARLGRYNESIKAYDETIRLDPNFAKAWYKKGEVLKTLGQGAEANAAISKARELGYTS